MAITNKSALEISKFFTILIFILDVIFGIIVISMLVNLQDLIPVEQRKAEIRISNRAKAAKYIKKSSAHFHLDDTQNDLFHYLLNHGQINQMVDWLGELILISFFALGFSVISLYLLCKNKVCWFYLMASAIGTIFPLFLVTLYCSDEIFPENYILLTAAMTRACKFYFLLSNIYKILFFYSIILFRLMILNFVGTYVYMVKRFEQLKQQRIKLGLCRGQCQGQMNCKKPVGNRNAGNKKMTTVTGMV